MRFRPRMGATPSPAFAAARTAPFQSARTPSCDAVAVNVRPPATNCTDVCASAPDRASSSFAACASCIPPTSSPPTVVPEGSRVADPARSVRVTNVSRATKPTRRTALRTAMRRERRRRAIPETLVAPDDTNGNVADPHTPSVPRNGVDPGPLTQATGDVAGPVVEPSSETDRHGRAAGPPRPPPPPRAGGTRRGSRRSGIVARGAPLDRCRHGVPLDLGPDGRLRDGLARAGPLRRAHARADTRDAQDALGRDGRARADRRRCLHANGRRPRAHASRAVDRAERPRGGP